MNPWIFLNIHTLITHSGGGVFKANNKYLKKNISVPDIGSLVNVWIFLLLSSLIHWAPRGILVRKKTVLVRRIFQMFLQNESILRIYVLSGNIFVKVRLLKLNTSWIAKISFYFLLFQADCSMPQSECKSKGIMHKNC